MAYDPAAQNINLLKHAILKSFDFNGRSSTAEFIIYYLASLFITLIIGWLLLIIFFIFTWNDDVLEGILSSIYLLSLFPFIALFTRRLHDINMSGWWCVPQVIFYLIAIAYKIITDIPIHQTINVNGEYWLIPFIIAIILFDLYVIFSRATVGANRYGEPNNYNDFK